MENKETIHKQIIKILKKEELTTTKIASVLNRSFYDTIKFLEELEEEKEIEKIEMGKFTFWREIKKR